jgi:parallel beta-helix repeat protein
MLFLKSRVRMLTIFLSLLSVETLFLISCVRCPPNQPPVAVLRANPSSGTAPLEVTFDISGSSDPDGIIMSYSLDFGDGTTPVTGTDITKPILHTYTTAGGFTATLTVTDNRGALGKDSVVITVKLANRSPVADSQSVATEEDTPLTVILTGSDPDGDPLTFNIITPPTNGSLSSVLQLSPTSAQVTYNPNANFYGSDSFSFQVNDGALDSSPATVSISITPVNDAPIAVISLPADSSTFTQGQAITFQGSANDVEDGSLTGASLVWTSSIDGQIGTGESFTRNDLSIGTHTITLVATDSQGAQGTDSVTIIINPPLARTWYVDDDFRDCPNADFNRIRDAINAASPGDTIMVCPGTYIECLVIEKSLILKGAGRGKSIIRAAGYGWPPYYWPPPVEIIGETEINVVVEGFTLTGSTGSGVSITGRARATVQNNEIINNATGISIGGLAQVSIAENVIQGGGGIVERWGIVVSGSAVADIRDNVILKAYFSGISLESSSYATIVGNMILENHDNGIIVKDNAYADILGNNILNNPYGIALLNSGQGVTTIQGNIISKNEIGIFMDHSAQAIIQQNEISENFDRGIIAWRIGVDSFKPPIGGILICGSTQALIQENRIVNNDYGVVLFHRFCVRGFDIWRSRYPWFIDEEEFKGKVQGKSNEISGNRQTEVCPSPELIFLLTEEGGCYGPKC